MANFRSKLYPEYKANRRKPAKPRAHIRVFAIDGGWCGEATNITEDPCLILAYYAYSPYHEERDAHIMGDGLLAYVKSTGYVCREVEYLTKEESVKKFLESGDGRLVTVSFPTWTG